MKYEKQMKLQNENPGEPKAPTNYLVNGVTMSEEQVNHMIFLSEKSNAFSPG